MGREGAGTGAGEGTWVRFGVFETRNTEGISRASERAPDARRRIMARMDRRSISPLLVRNAPAAGEILLLHPLGVELRGAIPHLGDDLLGGREISLDPAQRVDARDDERTQVRARQAALLQ